MFCARCHRPLLRTPIYLAGMALGPRCAALVGGSKPRRSRRLAVTKGADVRQPDLFEVLP